MHQLVAQLTNSRFQTPSPKPVVSIFGSPSANSVDPPPIRSLFFFLLTSSFLLLTSCEKNTTPVTLPNPQLILAVEDVAVTEAWLHLTVEDRSENLRFTLQRDDSLILNGLLTTDDTTLYDATLLPAHTYTYRAKLLKEGQQIADAGPLSITTMDTTSHNFTWQIDTIGTHSSVLHDVAIINESDIWAIGEIHTAETDTFDSLGNWIPPYNAIHWDGIEWELVRIFWQKSGSQGISELRSIFALSGDNIWVADTAPYHWNGQEWISLGTDDGWVFDGYVHKIWGASPDNIYYAGTNGSITYYTHEFWSQLISGTDVDLRDITGVSADKTWASGYTSGLSESILLEFDGRDWQVKKLSKPGNPPDPYIDGTIANIWASPQFLYVVSGIGVLRESIKTGSRRLYHWQEIGLPIGFSYSAHGTGDNNIFIVGEFGTILHFNGISWKKYPFINLSTGPRLRSVSTFENSVVAVGYTIGGKAIIFRGLR